MFHGHHTTTCRKRGDTDQDCNCQRRPVSGMFFRWNRGFRTFCISSRHYFKAEMTRGTGDMTPQTGHAQAKGHGTLPKEGEEVRPNQRIRCLETNMCAMFFTRSFTVEFSFPQPSLTRQEGPRKPARISMLRNIAKSRKEAFHGIFARKSRNIGLLRCKVPMFYPKSTDVLVQEVRCFRPSRTLFSTRFTRFQGKKRAHGDILHETSDARKSRI